MRSTFIKDIWSKIHVQAKKKRQRNLTNMPWNMENVSLNINEVGKLHYISLLVKKYYNAFLNINANIIILNRSKRKICRFVKKFAIKKD